MGKPIVARSVSAQEAIESGLYPGWVRSQEWTNEVSYGVDLVAVRTLGVPLTDFDGWAHRAVIQLN